MAALNNDMYSGQVSMLLQLYCEGALGTANKPDLSNMYYRWFWKGYTGIGQYSDLYELPSIRACVEAGQRMAKVDKEVD